jgi:Spore Coat Protein U domain
MKKIKKINNRSRLKTSTALTSFLGVFVVYSSIHGAYATTTTGVLNATASVVAACTVTADNIVLPAFASSDISGNGIVSLNCTVGTTGVISLNTAADASTAGKYNLYHTTSGYSTAADIIEVGLYKDGYSTALTSATPSWTASGTGAAVSIGTIGAKIDASGQTGKRNGTFNKSFTLLVTY